MTNNLDLWNKVSRVPPEHLKSFTRGGGFKGTAIKPMWSIMAMTEHFGPCGEGWGINAPEFSVHTVGNEILVYCTVSIWHEKRENLVFGVGGDKVLASQSNGLRSDDEAFKKAYTDATTNALKLLGVGADIHMGLWDGNKYIDEQPEQKPSMPAANGTRGASKAFNRGTYDVLVKEIRDATSVKTIEAWYRSNVTTLDSLPPDWLDELRIEYSDKISELKKGLQA